ncbi:hypothetical protein [Pedobacter cryophilus]|uniref:Uncharacterized protein n=1 Tax=Pedobacter cryophilus TaxID=2571271 RepID=A0A4U1C398_9SPHI|nr:hypothetical protein [Pedobacter cryophilus]TKB98776.1 hypothetical protein FA046_06570 [Pedobacter cryophilus]
MENLHIVFWLLKDISWCLFLKPLGIIMIVPTLTIAVIIAYRTRKMVSELCHNLAISLWILANSYWMVTEFLEFDSHLVYGDVTFKHLSLIPFFMGVFTLGYYYLYWLPKNPNEENTL